VLYARVSSQEQAREGFSIPAQEKLLRNYALDKQLLITSAFSDVETAKRAGRTGFDAMVRYLRKHSASCRVLLVEKTDRLYRNLRDWVTIDEIDGLEVHFVKQGTVISEESRSSDKFMHGIQVLMAKNYIDNLSEETRKGMTEKASQGIWPSYAPIGYRNAEGQNGKRTIVPDPVLAPLVQRLYELCATGKYSIKDLSAIAHREHLTRGGSPIQTSTVSKVLRNRVYSGEFEWRGVRYAATYEAIIPRDLWLAAQAALDRRLGTHAKKTGHCFPFSGMLRCGTCGFAMVGEIKKGKYVYYHCSGARGVCGEPYVRQEILERAYAVMLKSIALDEEVVGWIASALRQSHSDQKRCRDEAISKLKQEHLRLQTRLDLVYEDRLDRRIDVALFDRKSAEYRDRQLQILAEIERYGTADSRYVETGVRLLELAQNMHRLFEKQPAAEKRKLLDFVVSNSVWQDGKIVPTWRQPFGLIALTNQSTHPSTVTEGAENGRNQNWLPFVGRYRTFLRSRSGQQMNAMLPACA
jgi:DNA invertase Pin-like site-specific DNA recombinase